MKHCFVISAYGDSPYLEECIRSLKTQESPSELFLCTSTPSPFLKNMAGQYGLSYFVREGKSGLKEDWNFCIQTAAQQGAELVTIAHQDDVYLPQFAGSVKKHAGDEAALIFTAAVNMDGQGSQVRGRAEAIKRLLRLPLRLGLGRFSFGRYLSIAFGNSIPCPACTYHLKFSGFPEKQLFESNDRFTIDWRALLELSRRKGSFVYIPVPLVKIRLHDGAETMKTMEDGIRQKEEFQMFCSMHSYPVAWLLMLFYSGASKSYGK